MSNAHKGSRLQLKDELIPVGFSSAHFDFNVTPTGIQSGDFIQPTSDSIYTMREIEGKFGGAVAVEIGTTNLIETQGLASQDWSKWSHYGSTNYWGGGSTQFDDVTMGKVFQGTATGNSTYLYDYYPYTFTSGGAYTNSVYLKSNMDLPNQVINSYINSSSGGQHNIANSVYFTGIATEWQRYEATHIANQQATGVGGIGWALGSLPSGCILYASFPQLENKGFATSFVKGTRVDGLLKYPKEIINTSEGAISFWLYFESSANQFGGNPNPIFSSGTDPCFDLLLDSSGSNYLRAYTSGNVSTQINPTFVNDSWNHVVVYWKRNVVLGIYINNVLQVSSDSPVDWADFYRSNATGFCIGSGIKSNANIRVSELKIDKIMPTAEDVSSWYISERPFYNPYDYRTIAY